MIVHVPHINGNTAIFNRALAGFLLGAYDGYGFGIGFQYGCREGGWLELDKYKYALKQKLGKPVGDAQVSIAAWPTANCTYTTPSRPKPCPPGSSKKGCLETVGCLMSRSFSSGLKVFIGQYLPPTPAIRPQNHCEIIWWSDGTVSSPNASWCPQKAEVQSIDTMGKKALSGAGATLKTTDGAALHVAPIPANCTAELTALCNGQLCDLHDLGHCAFGQKLVALRDVGGSAAKCGHDATHEHQWRCYAENNTKSGAYVGGCCYCSRDVQLKTALCVCENGGPNSPHIEQKCPGYKPPAPTPPPEPPCKGATVFQGGEAPGYGWYFFPRVQQVPGSGELLMFQEAHIVCGHASDKGHIDIVMKRSSDNGSTWSAVEVVHSESGGASGSGSTTIGNPAPFVDAETSTLWLSMSRNNTDVLVMSSKDWGKTWSDAKVISEQVLSPAWYKGGPSSKPSYDGGWGWVATTGGTQLTVGPHKGRLLVSGDVQTAPTANCSAPYARQARAHAHAAGRHGVGVGDGKSCSQSWTMFSDNHGQSWNYSRTLMLPGDEVSNPAQLSNGSVIMNLRGHDLPSYDQGDPNNAMRWLARSDDGGTTWPSDAAHLRPLLNASSVPPNRPEMRFGGDCYGDMTRVPAVEDPPGKELLVMGAIQTTGAKGGIGGRSDYRVHASSDGGSSWTLVSRVYPYSSSYSGLATLNSTHVAVGLNVGSKRAGSMTCGALTKFVAICVRC